MSILKRDEVMKLQNSFFAVIILAVCVLLMSSRPAYAASFSYSVERFGFSGNLPGNVIDNFDNGILSPWTVQ